MYYYHPRIGSMKHTDTSVNVESIHGHPMTFRFQLLSDLGHSREEALGPRSKIVIQIWLVVSWFICYVLKHVGKKPEVALFFFCIFEEFGLPLSLAMETCSKPQDAKHVKNRIWVGTCFVWVRYFGTQLFLRFVLRFLSDLLMITVRCKRHKIWDDIFEVLCWSGKNCRFYGLFALVIFRLKTGTFSRQGDVLEVFRSYL